MVSKKLDDNVWDTLVAMAFNRGLEKHIDSYFYGVYEGTMLCLAALAVTYDRVEEYTALCVELDEGEEASNAN